jgi:hypothetical protein
MLNLFYEIKNNEKGGYTYHEFLSGWSGYSAFAVNDKYIDFNTLLTAENYAKLRGAVSAYF